MNQEKEALNLHRVLNGKIETKVKKTIETKEELALVYTPGVAFPCLEIEKNKELSYKYTWKKNAVAIITDGSAVLGLGNIGPDASLPVMEGKAAIFKQFANIDAIPIPLDTQDTQEIIRTIQIIAPSFAGINLEDISAPRCIEIEKALEDSLDIPVFHDDQHGTAIVVLAGLINALKVVKKNKEHINLVVSGTGAAGSAIIKLLYEYGIENILAFNKDGIIKENSSEAMDLLEYTNKDKLDITLTEAMVKADVFVGVSAGNLLTQTMVKSMNENAIVFALANPVPEISYDDAKIAGASVVATGRSDKPNQINNALVFPGLFRGLLDSRAKNVHVSLRISTAKAIASLISDDKISETEIIVDLFHPNLVETISNSIQSQVEALRKENHNI